MPSPSHSRSNYFHDNGDFFSPYKMARYFSGMYCKDDNLFINWMVKERDRNGEMSPCFSSLQFHPSLLWGPRDRLARERAGGEGNELLGLSPDGEA